MLKWMGTAAKEELCRWYNECAASRNFPNEWRQAEVVAIFKKGSPHLPANYRPISLLNTAYKLYAAVIASRLLRIVESKLRRTQYGFRNARSTGDPIHLIRRYQDMVYSRKNQTLHLLFLDWAKAFDGLDMNAMLRDLEALGLPKKSSSLLEALIQKPVFQVLLNGQASEWKEQRVGVRQGCTLSPLLFISSLTVAMEEAEAELREIIP
eukprot:15436110-Alexandrium_andersonii.AAC.1